MLEKTIYVCEYCGNEYKTIEQVRSCEEKCLNFQKEKEKEKEKDKILKKYHENDTRYIYHCVDCGTKLIEYEYCFDGIDVERGIVIFETERARAFGGLRCIDCNRELRDFVCSCLVDRVNERKKMPKKENK